MRYFFHIGYHGRNFSGWQRQNNAPNSVQQIIEEALSQILKKKIFITGCGRTDAQVHASQYFFHVDLAQPWDFDLQFRLNKVLPQDIAVFDIIPVESTHHARFDATHRTYDYFIHTYKNPFLNQVSSYYPERNLNLELIKRAISLLPEYQDYRTFCKTTDDYNTTLCTIYSATLFTDSQGDHLRFQITANRYLGKMIRIIVARLLSVGHNRLPVDEFERYLIEKKAPDYFEAAYPQGLFLSKVTYPFLDIPSRTEFSNILLASVDSWQAV